MDLKLPFRVTRRQFVTASAAAMAAGGVTASFAPVAEAVPAEEPLRRATKAGTIGKRHFPILLSLATPACRLSST